MLHSKLHKGKQKGLRKQTNIKKKVHVTLMIISIYYYIKFKQNQTQEYIPVHNMFNCLCWSKIYSYIFEAVLAEGITVVEMVVVGRANDGPVGFGTYMDGPWMKTVTNLQLVLVPLTWVILIYVA